jgi:flagellar operon protein
MDDKIVTNRVDPVLARQMQGHGSVRPAASGFSDVLAREIAHRDLKFSAHAQMRMRTRNIEMTGERMERLRGAVDRAEQKGAQDALVLLDDVALVVSVKNRTVITAVDGESIKENVFTNIDSAVIT